MASETFMGWAQRMTRNGTYNLTALIAFAKDCEAYWRSQGKDFSVAGWRKTAGRRSGKGFLPKTMKHPRTGEVFIFPIFESSREKGELVDAVLVSPKCKRCGSEMVRRTRPEGGDIFGCSAYPGCRFACDAWVDVAGGNPVVERAPKAKTPVLANEERLALRREIVSIIEKARQVVEDHGMTLPIGYRTVAHMAKLAVSASHASATPEERAANAWRLWVDGRVSKQERDKFDAAGLPSGSVVFAPSGDDNPDWYATVEKVLDAGLPVFLVGPAGSGKTQFAKWYAERKDKALEVAVGSGDVAGTQLWVARRDASGGTTSTVRGPAARAATNGDVLLLDEVDGFDSNALLPLNSILNGDSELSVPVLGSLEVSPECRIIAAANTNGRSKDRTYNARNRLDGAFLNRFAVVVKTTYESAIDHKVASAAIDEAFAALG